MRFLNFRFFRASDVKNPTLSLPEGIGVKKIFG